jgi:citrate lyase subunit beta/citryl-CoA lyase
MIAKATGIAADMVFFDLEDSVAPTEKAGARAIVAKAVRDGDWGDKVVGIRLNAWDSPFTLGDICDAVASSGPRLDVVVMPKVQRAADVIALDLVLTQIEHQASLSLGHIGIEAQIESARGLLGVADICAASPRLETVILGPGDLAASLEMPVLSGGLHIAEYPGDHFHSVFVSLLVAGRANGLQVIDGPYFRVGDLDGLRDYTHRPQVLGYDGKWAIHPEQVPVLNEMFSPTQEQFDRAVALLDAYDEATRQDRRGAVLFDGDMIDEASRKMAMKFVARGARAGRVRS